MNMQRKTGHAALAAAVVALAMTACAPRTIDPATAVDLLVENESDWDITLRAVRPGGIIDFERHVPRLSEGRFSVHHRAFGNARIQFELVARQGLRSQAFLPQGRVQVPEGALVHIALAPDLTSSTVEVYDRSERLAGTTSSPTSSLRR